MVSFEWKETFNKNDFTRSAARSPVFEGGAKKRGSG
jgi:hypothetical protein